MYSREMYFMGFNKPAAQEIWHDIVNQHYEQYVENGYNNSCPRLLIPLGIRTQLETNDYKDWHTVPPVCYYGKNNINFKYADLNYGSPADYWENGAGSTWTLSGEWYSRNKTTNDGAYCMTFFCRSQISSAYRFSWVGAIFLNDPNSSTLRVAKTADEAVIGYAGPDKAVPAFVWGVQSYDEYWTYGVPVGIEYTLCYPGTIPLEIGNGDYPFATAANRAAISADLAASNGKRPNLWYSLATSTYSSDTLAFPADKVHNAVYQEPYLKVGVSNTYTSSWQFSISNTDPKEIATTGYGASQYRRYDHFMDQTFDSPMQMTVLYTYMDRLPAPVGEATDIFGVKKT